MVSMTLEEKKVFLLARLYYNNSNKVEPIRFCFIAVNTFPKLFYNAAYV